MIDARIEQNCKALGISLEPQNKVMSTILSWPLKAAPNLTDCGFYFISAHVDEDTLAGTFKDYNCGTIAYDTHRGTDIATFPFPFYKMDNDQVQVIAAAPGVILDKADGNFDRNCASNNLTANYVVIKHADGSQAYYWHMKKNSVTTKAIGQSVAVGEYLGIVGSSGNATGPHLHFEVRNGSTVDKLVDPFSGTCNVFNASSWWASQKPYTEPAILKASVHTTDVPTPVCGTTETTNESTSFTIPFQGSGLPAGAAKFYIFFRNETNGMVATMSILNPDGSTFTTWTQTSTTTYNASYRGFTKTLPTITGTYTFKAVYNGITCSQTFDIINGATATITPSGPTTFCQGDSVILTATAGSSYLWSNSATSRSITVKANGTFTVKVTFANSTSATSAVTTVTVNSLPTATITASGNTTFCSGDSVTLTASTGSSYLWSNSATSKSITVKAGANYTVKVTGANGCSATSAVTIVTVNSLPTATITASGNTTFCSGDSVTLTSSTGSSYLWSNSATSKSITVKAGANYTVKVTGANGCSATSAVTIVTVNSLPTATITASGNTTFCSGDSVTLTSSTGSSYLWSNSATSKSITVKAGGNYTVKVTNGSNCSATSAATTVTVNSLPTATITASGNTTFCSGDSVTLTASTGSSYLWSNSLTSKSITVKAGANYTVKVTGANGCSATSAVTSVTVNSLPTATITASGNTTFCSGDSITLTASTGSSYLWSNSSTSKSITVKAGGNYTVKVTGANNCYATSTITTVMVRTPQNSLNITLRNDTLFSPYVSPIKWFLVGNPNSIDGASFHVCGQTGSYYVTGHDANGCNATSATLFVNCNVTVISTKTNLEQLQIFPNPTNGIINISGSGIDNGNYKFTLRNMIGQNLFEEDVKISNKSIEKTVSISDLPNDIYFLSIETTNVVMVKKILKQN